jgi:S-DNA-T family DNA segregation ATPase FtsK/SpoIIIE
MLYMAPDAAKLARLQGCFVSDGEIRNLVNYWRTRGLSPLEANDHRPTVVGQEKGSTPTTPGEAPWAGLVAESEKDDLLPEAIKLVTESGRASTSFLQRRLGIGYPRAARLMDLLEEEGLIGPADGSKPREVFWREEPDEADYDEFAADVAGVEVNRATDKRR